MHTDFRFAVILSLVCAWPTTSLAVGDFDLQVTTIGFSRSQRNAFTAAEELWESVIVGYAPGITQTTLPFSARKLGLDGPGGILGQAGPTGSITEGGFVISTGGSMIIDAADIDLLTGDGQLADAIAHEIGHILGIGTLWVDNGVYVNNSGQYMGGFGLQAYQTEFDAGASFVPVELDGGAGTANGHWDELDTVFDGEGRPLTEELMTGFLGTVPFLSQTTIQSLRDLGFEVIDPLQMLLPGDYNNDGIVDAADYTVWRNNLGAPAGTLPNDTGGGVVGTAQHATWKTNFGMSLPSSASLEGAAVPEPASVMLLLMGAAALCLGCRNSSGRVSKLVMS
jgi:hypothetical protein